MVQYGINIKHYREIACISQAQLGEIVGVKQQIVNWWEGNKRVPNAIQLALIADTLGVKMDDLRSGGIATLHR